MPSRVTAKTDIEDPLDVPPSFAGGTVMEAGGRSVGLGLSITRHIVQAHGGTIGVTSTAAEGTTFTVTLPRRAQVQDG